tara:strand:+ start:114 stop:488 length:375 start_codon:yes stop_codon:yes gene_type:complete
MGLDQYANKVKSDYDHKTKTDTITKTEIAYWRKHNALEGLMAGLYREKTGDEGEFNCKTLTLDSNDLDNLEKVVKAGDLPETVGFFFGSCTKDNEEYKEMDLEFIEKARKAIDEGYEIQYTSWW